MTSDSDRFDANMREAVSAIDAGDAATLERLLAKDPMLALARFEQPGSWLRDQVGTALDGFFERPYLLWFVAEDPVRTGRLPANVAAIAGAIIRVAQRASGPNLNEQLDYALHLVCWSSVAAQSGEQLALIDVLADAGAALDGAPENALVNGHFAAAEHLVQRGAPLSLATALCLGRWHDVDQLAPASSATDRQFALTLTALRGKTEALQRLIPLGVDLDRPSPDLYSHAAALHHAVSSGNLAAVKVIVAAGASLSVLDSAWNGTPLGWAEHARAQHAHDARGLDFAEIAVYLRAQGAA